MLTVIDPGTLIDVTLHIGESALAVGFVVHPVTFIHVAIRMDQSAVALTHSHHPHAFVHATIQVVYRAKAVLDHLSATKFRDDNKLALVKVIFTIDVTKLVQGVDTRFQRSR